MTDKRPYCPNCGKPATGSFCQHCGAKLGGRFCKQCGAKLGPSASFCNQCGSTAEGDGRPVVAGTGPGSTLPWWIAGVAVLGIIVVIGVQMVEPGEPGPVQGISGPAAGQSSLDLSTMSPREAADRLFNRVMTAVARGDSTEAQAFLPMAVQAYEGARPLDLDGLYHLSILQRAAFLLEEALASAEEILAVEPNHILGLGAAAEANIEMNRPDAAAARYRQLLEYWDVESERTLPEYDGHRSLVASMKTDAEAFLAGR